MARRAAGRRPPGARRHIAPDCRQRPPAPRPPPTQVALLAACKERGIPVLCSAGAGAKADPTRLRIIDISESSIDPLARAVRHKCARPRRAPPRSRRARAPLAAARSTRRGQAARARRLTTGAARAPRRLGRKRGIRGGIPVLMSTEKPRCELVSSEAMEAGNPLDFQARAARAAPRPAGGRAGGRPWAKAARLASPRLPPPRHACCTHTAPPPPRRRRCARAGADRAQLPGAHHPRARPHARALRHGRRRLRAVPAGGPAL